MPEMLFAHVRKHITLTKDDENLLSGVLSCRKFKKKEHLLKAGTICTENYFIIKDASGCIS
jgi:hypothetical protein